MKRLICEMCGSPDLIKQDGVFVCQSCGCKYSVEEARKLMVEGVIELSGSVKVDNSERINNLLVNGKRAFSDGKYSDAEYLFGQVQIEDPENATAILYQGLSLGWQGNTVRYNMDKTANATVRAIDVAYSQMKDSSEYAAFVDDALEKTSMIADALITLCKQNIENEKLNRSTALIRLNSRVFSEITSPYSKKPTQADIKKREQLEMAPYDTAIFRQYKLIDNTLLFVLSAYRKALGNLSNVAEYPESLYVKMNSYLTKLICMERDLKSNMYAAEAKELSGLTVQYIQKKAEIEELEKKKRIEEYWANHKERKVELEKELADLLVQKTDLQKILMYYEKQIAELNKVAQEDVPAKKEIELTKNKIAQLAIDKTKLGLFKGKEKKAIDEQIVELKQKIKDLESLEIQQETKIKVEYENSMSTIQKAISPISEKMNSLELRSDEINEELTKAR